MSKWYTVKLIQNKERMHAILMHPIREKNTFIEEQEYQNRCKIKRFRDNNAVFWIIAKFKDEADAMAFKLRWI